MVASEISPLNGLMIIQKQVYRAYAKFKKIDVLVTVHCINVFSLLFRNGRDLVTRDASSR